MIVQPFSFLNRIEVAHKQKWVAVGDSVCCWCEDSGQAINWTAGSMPSGVFRCVRYGNGIYMAVGIDVAAISTDGKVFSSIAIPTGNWSKCIYHETAGLWIVIRGIIPTGKSNVYLTSNDNGASWTSRTLPRSTVWTGLCYGEGTALASAYINSGNNLSRTADGLSWTSQSVFPAFTWQNVSYLPPVNGAPTGSFAGFGAAGNGRVFLTTDSTSFSWFNIASSINPVYCGAGYNNPSGTTIRAFPRGGANYILYSTGSSPSSVAIGQNSNWEDIWFKNYGAVLEQTWCAVSSNGAKRIATLGNTGSSFTMRGDSTIDAMDLRSVVYA